MRKFRLSHVSCILINQPVTNFMKNYDCIFISKNNCYKTKFFVECNPKMFLYQLK